MNENCFSNVFKMDFYSMELEDWLREELSAKVPTKEIVGAIQYDRTYGNIHILVEVLLGMYAVYLKDYNFGHIKPLGDCIYELDEKSLIKNSEEYLKKEILPDLSRRILNGEIDLDKELYDYYHVLTNQYIPWMEKKIMEYITVPEAASILGVSQSRVKKMVEDRVLDGFKRDNRVFLSKAHVEQRKAYIEKYGKPTKGKRKGSNYR